MVNWVGPIEDHPSDAALKVVSRRFAALLDPNGNPGNREAEIHFREGRQVLHSHSVHWEVVFPITNSPKVVLLSQGKKAYRVVLKSNDGKLFHIKRIECNLAGIRGRAVNDSASSSHIIEILKVSQVQEGHGVAIAFTDHPSQEMVELPIRLID
jgi:hypothetical protein